MLDFEDMHIIIGWVHYLMVMMVPFFLSLVLFDLLVKYSRSQKKLTFKEIVQPYIKKYDGFLIFYASILLAYTFMGIFSKILFDHSLDVLFFVLEYQAYLFFVFLPLLCLLKISIDVFKENKKDRFFLNAFHLTAISIINCVSVMCSFAPILLVLALATRD